MRLPNFLIMALVAMALTACGRTAPEAAGDPALDPLFAQLKAAPNATAAEQIEARIWAAWDESGSPTVNVLVDRAEAAELAGDAALARRFLDEATELAPDYAEAYNRRAALAVIDADYAVAMNNINETLRREPRHFAALTGLGVIYERLGQEAAALEAYRAALEIHPHYEQARQGAARLEGRVEGEPI